MSGASTVYVTYGPRNLHLKIGQNQKHSVKEVFFIRGLEVEKLISFPVLIINF